MPAVRLMKEAVSLPLPPFRVSAAPRISFKALVPPPKSVSLPSPPLRLSAPVLPVIMLSSALPIPVNVVPKSCEFRVELRFSMLAPRVKLARVVMIVSLPSPATSFTMSPATLTR